MALPSNSHAPKGTVNAKDAARVGVNAAGAGPQTPAGSYANAVICSPVVLQVLQLLEDELQGCGGMELGEVLRVNSGAQIPKWSVTTWIPSPASLLLLNFTAQIAWVGAVCVESVGKGSGPSLLLAVIRLLCTDWSCLGSGGIYFEILSCVLSSLCVAGCGKKGRGVVSKSSEIPIPWALPCL